MGKKKVLIFDDDVFYLFALGRFFKKKDINLLSFSTPKLYQCSHPTVKTCPVPEACTDYLLTDNKMPGMTGIEFLKRINKLDCKIPPERKAIISSNWLDEEVQEAKQLVSNVFTKSEAKDQLISWLDD